MQIPQNGKTTHQQLNTSTTRRRKRRLKKWIKKLALFLILSGLLVACVLSVFQLASQTTVEDQGTKEVLTTSETPNNTSSAIESTLVSSGQHNASSEITDTSTPEVGITFKLTAYCPCTECSAGYGRSTASGAVATAGRTIAVDPKVIPYGTKVVINGHTYIAEDCGSAVKGNIIDIFFDTHEETVQFGVQYAEVLIKEVQ